MDTEEQHTKRDRPGGPAKGPRARSRFPRSGAAASGSRPDSGPGSDAPLATGGRERAGRRPWLRRAMLLCIALPVAVLLLSAFVVQPFLIPSGSMEPTLRVGDRVLVNKLAYRFGSVPERGDVVVFDGTGSFVPETAGENPVAGLLRGAASVLGLADPPDTDFVKRVVGVGGDHVVCCDRDGRLEVDGSPLDEEYLHAGDAPSRVPFDIVVPQGTLWMMGDHRDRSSDSRSHLGEPGGGMVPVDRVIGRVDRIGWPWGRAGAPAGPGGAFDGVPEPGGSHG
ncbi:signal peptidase I [Streptomyces sp. NBC_01218]|uniref:signal peptidase I n=1 Tax=unclassified Streptomyces TaxID=2593676 RepID=UPI0023B8B5AD|nr:MULTISPECIES: signal peptidase I [unclassified Streptomyces]WEH39431.1 signal peptidase I [Streptomyces sp. AM 2-1-1]WSQ51129.1 signal peptidase I [Streptomyces sp. NBC_01218]